MPFIWTDKSSQAAILLAEGHIQEKAAEGAGISRRTLTRWLLEPEFSAEVDRLSLMMGVAARAERLRIVQRVVRQKVRGEAVDTDKDLLEWLKFAQSETDGAKLDIAAFADVIASAASSSDGVNSDREAESPDQWPITLEPSE